jgi:integrase
MNAYVSIFLWKKPRKNGTCSVKIRVTINRKSKYYSVPGVFVKPSEFNEKHGQVKSCNLLHENYNSLIRYWERKAIDHFVMKGGSFDGFNNIGNQDTSSLLEFTKNYIADAEKGIYELRPGTIGVYRSTYKRLREYAIRTSYSEYLPFRDITANFERKFTLHLIEHCDCQLNSVGKHIKIVKRLMKIAHEAHLHDNLAYQKFKVYKKSSRNKIYLTVKEISRLEKLDLSDSPGQERERDRFLLAYYTLLRFSDVTKVKEENLFYKDDHLYLKVVSKKTTTESIVPIKPAALEIMKKYSFKFDFTTNVHANREIKKICERAGINNPVTDGDMNVYKSQLVTFHTSRRSAATNLRLGGASLKLIADLGGWGNIKSLQTYLLASRMDSAESARMMHFFQ